jgi:predicted dehydrogenase
MSKKYTAAVVGLGRVGSLYPSHKVPRTHTAAYDKHPRIKMIAGVDPSSDARQNFVKKWGNKIPLFSSVDEMLTAKVTPEIVSICTPPEILLKNVESFAEQPPKMFFLEKPSVSNRYQSDSLQEMIGNIPTLINYHRCWDPNHVKFFSRLIGKKIITIRVIYSKGLLNYASHIVALLVQNCGMIDSVSKFNHKYIDKMIIDPSFDFIIKFEAGFDAFFQGFDGIPYELLELEVITDSGIYSLKSGGCRQRFEQPVDSIFYPNYKQLIDSQLNIKDSQVEGMLQAVDNIVDYLDKKTDKLQCDLRCGLDVFNIMEQVRNLYKI